MAPLERLERSNEMLSAIAGAQSAFIASGAAGEALLGLLALLLRDTGFDGGLVAEAPSPEREHPHARSGPVRVLARWGWEGLLPAADEEALFARALEAGAPAVEPGRACALPLKHGEHVIGLLAFAVAEPRRLPEALDGELEPVAATIATLIEAGRAYRVREEAEARHVEWRDAAEKQLRESERRFRRLVQGVEAIVWEADARTGRVSFVNERAERILGYPIAEWLDESDFRVRRTHPDDRAAVRRVLQSMPTGVRHHDFRMLAADGREVWFHEIVRLEAAEQGERLTGVMIDVSHARQLEKAVRTAAEEWVATFDAMESAVFLLDSAGMVKRLNQAAALLAGGSWRDCIGEELSVFGDGQPWCAALELAAAAAERRSVQDRQVVGGDGRWWHVEASARRRVPGRDQHVIVTIRDVTQVVELQNSVKRAQTMATIGSVVAGVAHEVRNPLFAMSVNIDVLASELDAQPGIREVIDALRVERDRISRLMQDLLDFGRPSSGASRRCALDGILRRAVANVQPVAAKLGIELQAASAEAADLDCHPERLEQVFQNVVENACQHSPSGSVVSLATRVLGDRVQVSVRDGGPGFPVEALPRVFEPFFTRRKGGTGLGLAIVSKIVDEHGGQVAAANHAEGGAVVTVDLPLASRQGRGGDR